MILSGVPCSVLLAALLSTARCFRTRSYMYKTPPWWSSFADPARVGTSPNLSFKELNEITEIYRQRYPSPMQFPVEVDTVVRSSYFANVDGTLPRIPMKPIEEHGTDLTAPSHVFAFNNEKSDYIYFEPNQQIYYFYDETFTIIVPTDTGHVYRVDQTGRKAKLVFNGFESVWDEGLVDDFPSDLRPGRVVPKSIYEELDEMYAPWLIDLQMILPPSVFDFPEYTSGQYNGKKFHFSYREELSTVAYVPYEDGDSTMFQFSMHGDYVHYNNDIFLIRNGVRFYLGVTYSGLRWRPLLTDPNSWKWDVDIDPHTIPPLTDPNLINLGFPEYIVRKYRFDLLKPFQNDPTIYRYENDKMNTTVKLSLATKKLKFRTPGNLLHEIDHLGNHIVEYSSAKLLVTFNLDLIPQIMIDEANSIATAADRFYEFPPCLQWDKLFSPYSMGDFWKKRIHVYAPDDKCRYYIEHNEFTLQREEVSAMNDELWTKFNSLDPNAQNFNDEMHEFLRKYFWYYANMTELKYESPPNCICKPNDPNQERAILELIRKSHFTGDVIIKSPPSDRSPDKFKGNVFLDLHDDIREEEIDERNKSLTDFCETIAQYVDSGTPYNEMDRQRFVQQVVTFRVQLDEKGFTHPGNCICDRHHKVSKRLVETNVFEVDYHFRAPRKVDYVVTTKPLFPLSSSRVPQSGQRQTVVTRPTTSKGHNFWDKIDRVLRTLPFVERLDRTTLMALTGVFVSILVLSVAFGVYLIVQRMLELRALAAKEQITAPPVVEAEVDRRMSIFPIID